MTSYQLTIADQDAVREEFARTADRFLELLASDGQQMGNDVEQIAEVVRSQALAELYAVYLPLVSRFVAAELDTDAASNRGMGRLGDGDPPPRIGAKYRKQLGDPRAKQALGPAIEKIILSGFASQAGLYKTEGAQKPIDEVWAMWLRHISGAYNDTNDLVSKARREEKSKEGLAAVLTMLLCDRGTDELLEGYEQFGVLKQGFLSRWRNARPLTYVSLFLGAGRVLFHVLTEKVDENFGALWTVEMLQDYQEPRNIKQATKMV